MCWLCVVVLGVRCCECLLHLYIMCWLCVVVLGVHLVLSVLAALIYYVLCICEDGWLVLLHARGKWPL